jgi:hypothetical protein
VTEGQNDFMIWDDLAITYPPQCTINLQTLAYLSQVWQTIFPGNVVVAGTAFTFDGGGGSLP